MKAKLIRKRLFAGIICLGLTGNLFLYNVSAAEPDRTAARQKAHWKISPAAVERRRTDRSRYLQQVSGIQPLRMKTRNRLLRMTPASRISQSSRQTGQSDNSGQPENSGQSDNPGQPDKDQQGQEPAAVSISREEMSKGLESGQEFQVSLILKNTSPNTDLKNVKLQIETTEA